MAYPKSHNPFADDEEEEGFKPKNRDFDGEDDDSGLSDAERRQRYLRQEELVRQGEALKRADKMLEGMDQDLKTSQKHINSIKSVWGGLVNYFKGKPDAKPTPEEPNAYETNERPSKLQCYKMLEIYNGKWPVFGLQKAMSSSREHEDKYQASHPNLRKLETGGFGAASSFDSGSSGQNGYPQNSYLKEAHHTLDKNLDEMSFGLSRLKNLGLGLQSEIEDQDESIDSLMNKVDKMDLKITNTNQQLKNLK
uniref:Synaptosomal-associated protein 29 n=1 Tax=Nothobranchius pienaari TaxID=704102 RepID=A0A1A8MBP3_9TELE